MTDILTQSKKGYYVQSGNLWLYVLFGMFFFDNTCMLLHGLSWQEKNFYTWRWVEKKREHGCTLLHTALSFPSSLLWSLSFMVCKSMTQAAGWRWEDFLLVGCYHCNILWKACWGINVHTKQPSWCPSISVLNCVLNKCHRAPGRFCEGTLNLCCNQSIQMIYQHYEKVLWTCIMVTMGQNHLFSKETTFLELRANLL